MRGLAALRVAAPALAAAALLLLVVSGPGTRLGLWPWQTGLGLLRWAVYVGAAGAVLALAALVIPGARGVRVAGLAIALAAALVAVAFPLGFQHLARSVPPIHDITTDPEDPPAFAALLPKRAGATNPPGYAGRAVAEQQRAAYPDIQPLVLAIPVAEAFTRAQRASQALGWNLVAAEAGAGRLEATATSRWFGFEDDVVVRVTPAGTSGARVDVRSKSRVGRGDAGANAKRVRGFLAEMRRAQ